MVDLMPGFLRSMLCLRNPELFDACIAGSPMIGHCAEYMQELAKDYAKRTPSKNNILYMIYGTEDSPE